MPDGADAIVIQEDARRDGDAVTVLDAAAPGRFVRPSGLDFRAGDTLLSGRAAPRCAPPRRSPPPWATRACRCAAGRASRSSPPATSSSGPARRPGRTRSSPPTSTPSPRSSPAPAARRSISASPATRFADLERGIAAARDGGADLLVTLGGASVGEHDLVQSALARQGMELGFWRVALRPGKPLMHGRLGPMLLLGLPGNPVSSIVCGILFVVPAIRALARRSRRPEPIRPSRRVLGADLRANDSRQDYLRATLAPSRDGLPVATALPAQDSSMLGILARADALIVRPPHAPAAQSGEPCRIIRLASFV